jgi:hypothetical protein
MIHSSLCCSAGDGQNPFGGAADAPQQLGRERPQSPEDPVGVQQAQRKLRQLVVLLWVVAGHEHQRRDTTRVAEPELHRRDGPGGEADDRGLLDPERIKQHGVGVRLSLHGRVRRQGGAQAAEPGRRHHVEAVTDPWIDGQEGGVEPAEDAVQHQDGIALAALGVLDGSEP